MPGPFVPPEMEEKALTYLKETDPGRFEDLQRIKAEKPMAYGEVLRDVLRDKAEMTELKEREPEEYKRRLRMQEIQRELKTFIVQYRAKEATAKPDDLAAKIKKLLEEEFDLRQVSQESRLKNMTDKIEREKQRLGKRREAKAVLVESRFKELSGESDHLKW